jgi:aminoglycoside/choline kinase family phosphotransferase
MSSPEKILKELYKSCTGSYPDKITLLPASGSDRSYYRLHGKKVVIGAWNETIRENDAFIAFTRHFFLQGLPVPEVFIVSDDHKAYLQTDLGDDTLFSLLTANGFTDDVVNYYNLVVRWLPFFQVKGFKGLDLSYCYPRHSFDRQSMMWDLNYFKYYFARLSCIDFDEQALEDDFQTLVNFLLEAESNFFMFRDFQSRNIMIVDNNPYFIDYQGGRSGPLQYDLASLLFDAKANLSPPLRNELMEVYLTSIEELIAGQSGTKLFDRSLFLKYFDGFVLLRILQALGAYGFRGFYQKKEHFLQSIPYAMKNLRWLFSQPTFTLKLPELTKLPDYEKENPAIPQPVSAGLNVRVTSFSYKQGIPNDKSGNGGGFVFDCRALPNPGRLTEYQTYSGLDQSVATYLKGYPEMETFLNNVFNLVDAAVVNYKERGFKNLMVSFGCTGGQHRSVYCAEKLANHLHQKFGLNIVPEHTEKKRWKSGD